MIGWLDHRRDELRDHLGRPNDELASRLVCLERDHFRLRYRIVNGDS